MNQVKLVRNFNMPAQTVFDFVSKSENLVKWWGPQGMSLCEHNLNLHVVGPWSSTMMNSEGQKHKVTGQVTKVDAPRTIEFTWAWHDDNDERGFETQVRFDVEENGPDATVFTLTHSGFADEEGAQNHNQGWTSSLEKLVAL